MFAYCIYFYIKSNMSGFMQLVFFLGYNAVMCYGFFFLFGTISFRASLMFVRRIYHAVKSEWGCYTFHYHSPSLAHLVPISNNNAKRGKWRDQCSIKSNLPSHWQKRYGYTNHCALPPSEDKYSFCYWFTVYLLTTMRHSDMHLWNYTSFNFQIGWVQFRTVLKHEN